MRIRWTIAAATDMERISDYLREYYPHYRQPTLRKLYDTIRALKEWPERGRPGAEPGTGELVFSPLPYITVYRVREDAVEILRIYHAAQMR